MLGPAGLALPRAGHTAHLRGLRRVWSIGRVGAGLRAEMKRRRERKSAWFTSIHQDPSTIIHGFSFGGWILDRDIILSE